MTVFLFKEWNFANEKRKALLGCSVAGHWPSVVSTWWRSGVSLPLIHCDKQICSPKTLQVSLKEQYSHQNWLLKVIRWEDAKLRCESRPVWLQGQCYFQYQTQTCVRVEMKTNVQRRGEHSFTKRVEQYTPDEETIQLTREHVFELRGPTYTWIFFYKYSTVL